MVSGGFRRRESGDWAAVAARRRQGQAASDTTGTGEVEGDVEQSHIPLESLKRRARPFFYVGIVWSSYSSIAPRSQRARAVFASAAAVPAGLASPGWV